MKKKQLKIALDTMKMLLEWKGIDIKEIAREFNLAKQKKEPNKEIPQPYELFIDLVMDEEDSSLRFCFYDESHNKQTIGLLLGKRLHFISKGYWLDNYNLWCDEGCKIFEQEPILYNEGKYQIEKGGFLRRVGITMGYIINFIDGGTTSSCKDSNIIRDKKNLRPVLF
jgi:hypothetical protein